MAERKVALVLTGGGAKGAFQYAAEKYAREVMGYRSDVIAGVSGGALNGTMLSMEKYAELEHLWTEVLQNKPIYTGDLGTGALLRFAAKQLPTLFKLPPFLGDPRALLGNEPLRGSIAEHFDRSRVVKDLRIGVVSLESGAYHVYRLAKGEYFERQDRAGHTGDYVPSPIDDTGFKQVILGSTAIPVVWPPQNIPNVMRMASVVDGGVRNVNPIGDVLDALGSPDDEVVVISCDPPAPQATGVPRTGVEIATRSLDLVVAEIVRTDIREFERINYIVKQAEAGGVTLRNERGRPFVSYTARVIQPEEALNGPLDFAPEAISKSIERGRDAARKVLGDSA